MIVEIFIFHSANRSRLDKLVIAFFGLAPIVAGALVLIIFSSEFLDYSRRDFTLAERLMTQANLFWFYFSQVLFPNPNEMGLYLDDWPITKILDVKTGFSIFGILLLLTLSLKFIRFSFVGFGFCWFVCGHLIESTVFPLEIAFEHRNYLPAWGLIFALVIGTLGYIDKLKVVLGVGLSVLAMVNVFHLAERVQTWKESITIAAVSYTLHPKSYRAAIELAIVYLNVGELEKGRELLGQAEINLPKDLGIGLSKVLTYCSVGEDVPERLLSRVEDIASDGKIGVYGLKGLNSLSLEILNGRCPTMPVENLEKIVDKVISSNSLDRYLINRILAQSMLAIGNFDRAGEFYQRALGIRPNLDLVSEIIGVCVMHQSYDFAIKTLDFAKQNMQLGRYEEKELSRLRRLIDSMANAQKAPDMEDAQ